MTPPPDCNGREATGRRRGQSGGGVIPCGVALVRRGREYLIAQRKRSDTFGLFWEFPGGKKNPDETFEECVAREIKEEVGIDIEVGEKFMELKRRYNQKTIWLHFYLCTYVSGEARPLDCEKIMWETLEGLKSYQFPPANDRVIRKLIERRNREK